MTSMDHTIENALAEVAKVRAARERQMAQRAEMQRRAEAIMVRPPVYILKKYGGQQLTLDLTDKPVDRAH
ncbi:hypothetical protein NOF55_21895 [Rhizobiaceae bacterium BDR2-2]|uniref:Uncharacterized protein n=1 Tax=Ectorhizobium quercum TaxID=2965071 RepID=A0AAE3N4C9_9HYPH|nr:hypothetical protein [Ectorhizobium quercum]MCX8999762.1 hypothetical protein [Ectorhizobium quercum]